MAGHVGGGHAGGHSVVHGEGEHEGFGHGLFGRPGNSSSGSHDQAAVLITILAAFYCFFLIAHIFDELNFYKRRHYDFTADNGKTYQAQLILAALFPNYPVGILKLAGEALQLLILLTVLLCIWISILL